MINKSRELWQSRINEYRASEKTAKQWCEENNISSSTLKYWITRLNKEQSLSVNNTEVNNTEFVPILSSNNDNRMASSATIRLGKISIDIVDGCQPSLIVTVKKSPYIF